MKYWEIIADNLSKAGFSWGCVSAIDSNGRTIWIADAQRNRTLNLLPQKVRSLPVPEAKPPEDSEQKTG